MGEESWRFNPKKIKELRECLTYHTFGRLMDKPKPGHVIKAWELGKSKPGAESIAALCDVTGKSPNYFFTN